MSYDVYYVLQYFYADRSTQRGERMSIKREAFESTRLEEERSKDKGQVFSLWLNNGEIADLVMYKELLQQDKDSTTIKQLVELGKILIDSDLTASVMSVVLSNIKKNERLGLLYIEGKSRKSNRNLEDF